MEHRLQRVRGPVVISIFYRLTVMTCWWKVVALVIRRCEWIQRHSGGQLLDVRISYILRCEGTVWHSMWKCPFLIVGWWRENRKGKEPGLCCEDVGNSQVLHVTIWTCPQDHDKCHPEEGLWLQRPGYVMILVHMFLKAKDEWLGKVGKWPH
jgi:hypothetical protein